MWDFLESMKNLRKANPDSEGAFRRGYHQAIAEVVHVLRNNSITADELDSWVEEDGMKWRKDMPLEYQILPPKLTIKMKNRKN